ncbi:MAG TPA: hypothetical protein EYP17_04585 [Candidatus Latescibacteria bacterium]|nr:hypothetical protein [Candidatus Latescibacterota bacterium]
MCKSILIVVLMMITVLTFGYMVYADADGYTMTEEDLAEVLAEGRGRWDEALTALSSALNHYDLWDEAERLWTITERSVRKLAGQTFPSRQEAFRKAHYLTDGLIASGISILEELIRRERASWRPLFFRRDLPREKTELLPPPVP